ncbi:hypothetical protein BKA58DRAFT_471405 [Alternaria rosae]|uniref:uncharacterized protein n=1 Tax=Alternaria rosae TaxID=1187941 RepID=UPI001E8D303B|nr:uncharacterized protein BKA58DRAFT_471405 [Alternaria rosae]KAH6865421.1 hypothetical protein BKA58DRAFT_471405 [Alternaria rosae]
MPFGSFFGGENPFSTGRSSRRDAYSSSSSDPYSYGSSSSSIMDSPFSQPYGDFTSQSRCETTGSSRLGRAASQREPYDSRYKYRDLSPMRTSERPRAYTNKHSYDDHRSVSPLGSSRFEQPSTTSRLLGSMGRSSTSSSSSRYGSGASSYATPSYASNFREPQQTSFTIDRGYERPSTSGGYGGGLYRSSAVRGGEAPRRMGSDGEYGAHLGSQRRPQMGSNFQNGGFNWMDF